jgi:hypothetical protein
MLRIKPNYLIQLLVHKISIKLLQINTLKSDDYKIITNHCESNENIYKYKRIQLLVHKKAFINKYLFFKIFSLFFQIVRVH